MTLPISQLLHFYVIIQAIRHTNYLGVERKSIELSMIYSAEMRNVDPGVVTGNDVRIHNKMWRMFSVTV